MAVYLTTQDLHQTLARQRDLRFTGHPGSGAGNATVDPTTTYQKLDPGFGVAMTDTSAYLLQTALPAKLRTKLLNALFSTGNGIGLSFLRVPIGGSDFVVHQPYTYDDMPAGQTDPSLAHFSLDHDRAYVIPMIRQALAINRRIAVMANPWTPPAWMKTDDKLVTTTGPLGTLIPTDHGVYANYLIKFLQGYRAAGIPVDYLGVQNEPLTPLLFVAGIPESFLSPQDEGNLIHDDVAPALARAGLGTTRILAYDDAFQRSESYIPIVMSLASHDVGGLAYHCYLSDASSMSTEHSLYPNEPALETECSSNLSNIEPSQMAIRSLRNWAQGVQLWNAAVDQNGGPKIGNGCQGLTPPHLGVPCTAPAIIDTTKHRYMLTSDYWELAQFSKFIQLGARRIASTTPNDCIDSPAPPPCGLEDVAFRNPDGSQVLVATTHDGQPHTLTVTENGQSFSDTVPDGATVTFVWPAPRPRLSHVRIRHRGRRLKVRFRISEAATATLTVTGRGGRALVVGLGFRTHVHRGVNTIRLLRPRPGAYRLRIFATDAGGDRSNTIRRRFHIRTP
ncbi:MAG TPA: glycoside hydrolase family 30 beta sandwich domain-containing protein [Solirubrobacteraceae bacterium]